MDRLKRSSRKVAIGIVGGIVLLAGIVMIPYPGPGWLVVFVGLGILAQEFPWAQGVLDYAKDKYDTWQDWIKKQSRIVQAVFLVVTCVVVILTIWLLNGYGLLNHWFHLHHDWVDSPLFK